MERISKLVTFALSCSRSEAEEAQTTAESVAITSPPEAEEKLPKGILSDEEDEVDLGVPLSEQMQQLRVAAGKESESSESFEEVDLASVTSTEVATSTSMRTATGERMAGGMMGMGGMRGGMRAPPVWVCTEPMAGLPGCPPGLEYLTMVDTIIVQQLVEWVEVMTGYETSNRYILRNTRGEQIYYAFEESDPFSRQCNGNNRTFTMHIVDNFKREVARVVRPYACCGSNAYIEAPVGVQIGTVNQDCGCCGYDFTIHDNGHQPVFRVIGPACWRAGEFPIVSPAGGEVGRITKMFTNLYQEMYTDADTFGVQFPMDLHPAMKATLLGACFLVDFLYFEKSAKDQNNGYGGGYGYGGVGYGAGYGYGGYGYRGGIY